MMYKEINNNVNAGSDRNVYHIRRTSGQGSIRTSVVDYTPTSGYNIASLALVSPGLSFVQINGTRHILNGSFVSIGIVNTDIYDWKVGNNRNWKWTPRTAITGLLFTIGVPVSNANYSGFTQFSRDKEVRIGRILNGQLQSVLGGVNVNMNFNYYSEIGIHDYGQGFTASFTGTQATGYNSGVFSNNDVRGDYTSNISGFYQRELNALPNAPGIGDVQSFSYNSGQKIQRTYTWTANGWFEAQTDNSGIWTSTRRGK